MIFGKYDDRGPVVARPGETRRVANSSSAPSPAPAGVERPGE
jgi:hypothetical protein